MGFITWVKNVFGRKPKKISEVVNIPEPRKPEVKSGYESVKETFRERKKKEQPTITFSGTKKFRSKGTPIKKIDSTINSNYINQHKHTLDVNTPERSANSTLINRVYQQLLQGKIADQEMFETMTGDNMGSRQVRNLLLRKRIHMEVLLEGDKSSAKIEITGILPEEEHLIKEYFVGTTLESSSAYYTALSNLTESLSSSTTNRISSLADPTTYPTTIVRAHITTTFQ